MDVAAWNRTAAADRHTLLLKRPSSYPGALWRTALPAGDGYTGALMYGAAYRETIILTRHDLWAGAKKSGQLPKLDAELAQMRVLISKGQYVAARDLMSNALEQSGHTQTISNPFPLGAILLEAQDISVPFNAYRRGVHMDTGECFVRWQYDTKRCMRRMFLSLENGVLYLKAQTDIQQNYKLSLDVYDNEDEISHPILEQIRKTATTRCNGNFLCYSAQIENAWFGAVLLVEHADDVVEVNDNLVFQGTDITVKVKTFAREEPQMAFEKIKKELLTAASYAEAMASHIAIYQPKYFSAELTLTADAQQGADETKSNEELLEEAYDSAASTMLYEKLWRFGRYLFLSGCAQDGNPFALYGLWAGNYNLPWTQNVANENVQMIYWHALTGGMEWASRALIRYYHAMLPAFKKNARCLFGCRGIFIPGYTAPASMGGVPSDGPCVAVPVILNWISCAGWLSGEFYKVWLYTGDHEFMQQYILPFTVQSARFYADYAVWDGEGYCQLSPSVSPENTPGNLMPDEAWPDMQHACPTVKNATMDFAVMKETLTHALRLVQECKLTDMRQETEYWEKLLAAIPPYSINEDGAIKEWMSPDLADNYNHRHLSHLYPVFPGNEVRCRENTAQLAAFQKAVQLRRMQSQSGWAFAHLAAIWARFGQGEKALAELDLLTKSCLQENFFTLHNDWRRMGASLDLGANFAPIQLDALMGLVNALQEMLVSVSEDTIYLLPALPKRFSYVKLERFHLPGGLLSLQVDGNAVKATITAVKAMQLTLVLPSHESCSVKLQSGESKDICFILNES